MIDRLIIERQKILHKKQMVKRVELVKQVLL